MSLRLALAAATILCAPAAYAVVDPPAASAHDGRMRTIPYDRTNPVQLYAAPGASLRIQLGADEEIVGVVVSDQGGIVPEDDIGMSSQAVSVGFQEAAPRSNAPKVTSCDANLCRSVFGNMIYLKPVRPLSPQPLFIQTKRCSEAGKCEMVPYTFELLTRPGDLTASTPNTAWDVTFTYPDRDAAAKAAEAAKRRAAQNAAWRERQAMAPAPPAAPALASNWRYAYRGSAAVQPNEAWDDGRTTFLRFSGNRRVPNVYQRLPDGTEAVTAYAAEPDATGVTLRIARTETKWFIRYGDEAGCLFNVGSDPRGAASTTVALPAPINIAAPARTTP